ncbi:MAG: 2-oxo-4-hydroxy-4-carboxy-5-ureidoimidazoline decarboxylase [Hyphomicrobiales bacterium]
MTTGAPAILNVAAVNAMSAPRFVDVFGGIAEHSPWVAERASVGRPFATVQAMATAFHRAILDSSVEEQLALLRAHPDLAGRAAVAGNLTQASRGEQAGAGLDRLSAEEFARFTDLNDRYRARFGFPFILAVKGADKHAILAAFEARIGNDRETELATALEQVARIVRFRLEATVTP